MAIGTPVLCFNGLEFIGSGSPTTITTAIAAGSLIVLIIYNDNADNTVTSVVDSGGNTYTIIQNPAVASVYGNAIAYCVNSPNALTTSSTFTITNGAGAGVGCLLYSVSGANGGVDQSVTNAYNATQSFNNLSATTGTLATANEIAFAAYQTLGSGPGTWTEGAGFTTLMTGTGQTTSSYGVDAAYSIVSSTAAITWAPSWTTTDGYSALLVTFQATGAGGGGPSFVTLIGVKGVGLIIG